MTFTQFVDDNLQSFTAEEGAAKDPLAVLNRQALSKKRRCRYTGWPYRG